MTSGPIYYPISAKDQKAGKQDVTKEQKFESMEIVTNFEKAVKYPVNKEIVNIVLEALTIRIHSSRMDTAHLLTVGRPSLVLVM